MNVTARTLAGVFVLAFGLTVVAAAAGGFVLAGETAEQQDIETDHWEFDRVAPESAEVGGEITMDSSEPSNTVMIHFGTAINEDDPVPPGQPPLPFGVEQSPTGANVGSVGGTDRDVAPLTDALVENGHEVEFYSSEFEDGPLRENLAQADAFISTAPAALGSDEEDAVEEFVEAGGRTLVTADPGSAGDTTDLTSSFGLSASAGYLYDLEANDNNYLSVFVEPTGAGQLTDGVDTAMFRGAAPVAVSGGTPTFVTDETTQLSTSRSADVYGVAAESEDIALIGDSSFLIPENAYRADNNHLVGNVADFLVTGEEPSLEPPGNDTGGQTPPPETEAPAPPSGATG